MLRHQSEMELSGPWAGVGISQGGGALWSPSQPEMGVGKGGARGLAKTRIRDKGVSRNQEHWKLRELKLWVVRMRSQLGPHLLRSLERTGRGRRVPVALVKVGSSSGSFSFLRCLHPSHDQHFSQSWDPPALCLSLQLIWVPLWPENTLSPPPSFGL